MSVLLSYPYAIFIHRSSRKFLSSSDTLDGLFKREGLKVAPLRFSINLCFDDKVALRQRSFAHPHNRTSTQLSNGPIGVNTAQLWPIQKQLILWCKFAAESMFKLLQYSAVNQRTRWLAALESMRKFMTQNSNHESCKQQEEFKSSTLNARAVINWRE